MKYILLSPLTVDQFNLETNDELAEALAEFGCGCLLSHFPNGDSCYFATATTKDTLMRMCETVDLPGIVLEYSVVYDQAEIIS